MPWSTVSAPEVPLLWMEDHSPDEILNRTSRGRLLSLVWGAKRLRSADSEVRNPGTAGSGAYYRSGQRKSGVHLRRVHRGKMPHAYVHCHTEVVDKITVRPAGPSRCEALRAERQYR